MKLQLGRRDHHHLVYHHDHGIVLGGAWAAPVPIERVVANVLDWCRNTGINVFDFHINSITRQTLGLEPYTNAEPPYRHIGQWGLAETVRQHRETGIDTVAEIGRALRAQGIAFWIGIRVNDIHHTPFPPDTHSQPKFWVEHPECRTGESLPRDPIRSVGALDFAHEAVRDHTRGIVRTTLDRYDVDGIELDFTRMAILFKTAEADRHRDMFTAWMRDVRAVIDAAARARGHPIVFTARVPSVAEQCHRFGADVLRWIDTEIVHVLTASTTRIAEFEMPLEPFLRAARNRDVLVFAGIEGLQPDGVLSREMYRAWAFHYWQAGVDGLHLFNNCYNFIYGGGPHPISELHDPEWLQRLDKRYAVTRATPENELRQASDAALSYPKQLPQPLTAAGSTAEVRITVDDDVDSAPAANALAALTLRLRVMELSTADRLRVQLNGIDIPEQRIRIRGSGWERRQANLPGTYREGPVDDDACGAWQWVFCDLTGTGLLRSGVNTVSVELTAKNPDVLAPPVLYNVEIDIRYRRPEAEGNRQLGSFGGPARA